MPLFQYGFLVLLCLTPNFAFARFDPMAGVFLLFLYFFGAAMLIFAVALYIFNKKGGSIPRKIGRIALALLLYIVMVLAMPTVVGLFIGIVLSFGNGGYTDLIAYCFMFICMLWPPAYFAPWLARKIIR